ncbi:MAG TPA: hypothetical protein PLZ14_04890 [Acidovorax temperans]|nr:hypothetical protein [Acidovorax temperans]
MDKAVLSGRATTQLSTQKSAAPKLLSVSQRFHTDQRTWFFATQVRAAIEKNAVVHKKGVALLLLLFQYKAFKEQPINRREANRAGL